MIPSSGFKAYDIRGEVPRDIDESLAYMLGLVFVAEQKAQHVVVGYDVRETSIPLAKKLIEGLRKAGADVTLLGLCGTEEVYFNTVALKADGGIMITASHNPKNHNGFKIVGRNAEPISRESGLLALKERIEKQEYRLAVKEGELFYHRDKGAYIERLLQFFLPDEATLKSAEKLPLTVVVNSGNGCAGAVVDLLEPHLPCRLIKVNQTPDGSFPNGVPNPLIPERRKATQHAILEHKADFGVAWDGDFDRCFFFDHRGEFIDSCYIVGLLASEILRDKAPGETVVIDARQIWNSRAEIEKAGGRVVISSGGHSPMKRTMRREGAIYGGEMSAHHYFRDFDYCDSGMIPFLLMLDLLMRREGRLYDLVKAAQKAYPCSGELNFSVRNNDEAIDFLAASFADETLKKDWIDGLSLELQGDLRINIRGSNTEPLLRVNIESKASEERVEAMVERVHQLLTPFLLSP